MSSRILPAESHADAAPLVWRKAGEPGMGPEAGESAAEAQRMAALQNQAEQRARDAYAAGLREGEAAGRSKAAAELQPVLDRLARAIDDIAGLRGRLRAEAEADLLRLALAIAHRVLRREVSVDPEALHGLVLGALERLQGQEIARVRVHPSHAQMLINALGLSSAAKVEVVADAGREPGTVIFETPHGNLDASIESQLQEIERGLADRLRKCS